MPTPSPPKPILVFLHGAGTSASIFRLQSRRLAAQLSPHFDLVYLDAPHACPAGPGVLPFFEGCGPYLRWVDDEAPERERAYWAEGEGGEVDRVHLIGEDDPWRPESEKLVEFFYEARRKVIVFEGGHQMPAAEWVNTQAVRVVLDACGL
ncbi:62a9a291-1933-4faf-8a90-64975e7c9db1 [Thermothielavioides terrestris]|uniref:62a9a291-1933-4faf-8a90-64975e7c9db1 n=1 Tax=Thermothielavioides terrestris TaxID=2587410 RepID=A0A3S4C718_9PEZI|nr:62a9a291-1933-4faf-8a90-64975e7c9db1 [Thermothielavioides terrestris]